VTTKKEKTEWSLVPQNEYTEMAYVYYESLEIKDLVVMMILISVLTQVAMKLIENALLSKLASLLGSGGALMAGCCRRKKDSEPEDIQIDFITASGDSTTGHLHWCQYVHRMRNPKTLRICTDCQSYLRKETSRVVQQRLEELI
jgi:hypothetical protein